MTESKFWIYRAVDPIAANNEHYDDWWEYKWVTESQWQRIQSHSHRLIHKWQRQGAPQPIGPIHQLRVRRSQ